MYLPIFLFQLDVEMPANSAIDTQVARHTHAQIQRKEKWGKATNLKLTGGHKSANTHDRNFQVSRRWPRKTDTKGIQPCTIQMERKKKKRKAKWEGEKRSFFNRVPLYSSEKKKPKRTFKRSRKLVTAKYRNRTRAVGTQLGTVFLENGVGVSWRLRNFSSNQRAERYSTIN